MSNKIDIPKLQLIKINGLSIPFAFRPNSTDVYVMQQIFQNRDYVLPIKDFQPKLILDCGGNIGCASVFFANVYPSAQIYAIEPERMNFKIMVYNTVFYDNVILRCGIKKLLFALKMSV